MSNQEPIGLAGVDVISGVNQAGKPFCHIMASSPDAEVVLEGQLTPEETRKMALQWLEAAEAAESDALVMAELREAGLDDQHCAAFLVGMRKRRGDGGGK